MNPRRDPRDPRAARRGWAWRAGAIALGVALLGGCVSREVHVASAPGASFATYHSFAVGPANEVPGGFRASPESVDALHRTPNVVARALVARGYQLASSGQPDLVVQCSTGWRRQSQMVTTSRGTGGSDVGLKTITESALSIDVFDRASGHRLWHGDAVEETDWARPSDGALRDTVDAILRTFPRAADRTGT